MDIKELIEKAVKLLEDARYSSSRIYTYRWLWSKGIIPFKESRGLADYNKDVGMDFMITCHNEGVLSNLDSCLLAVKVENMAFAKTRISGSTLPEGAEIGVFVRATDGSLYNGVSIDNVKYTSVGTGLDQSWLTDPTTPIELLPSKATAFAYYPWQETGVSLNCVEITNDGTDWMYTAIPATNLSNKNNVARFHMFHALSIIRCKVVKGDYDGAGTFQTLSVKGEALASAGVLDLQAGEFTEYKGLNTFISQSVNQTISEVPLEVDTWALSTDEQGTVLFQLVIDGKAFLVNVP